MQNIIINNIKKVLKFIIPTAIFCLMLFVMLKVANAESALGGEWDQHLTELEKISGDTGEEMAMNFIRNGINIIKYILGGIALIMGIIYAIGLIFSQGSEDSISKNKKAFIWVFTGFFILMISENISNIFNPEGATTDKIIDFNSARDQLRDIAQYLKWIFGSIIVFIMTISGIKMVTASGDEEVITSQKRNMIWSMMGMLFILLSSNIVNAIYVINSPNEIVSGGAQPLIEEIGGIISLILIFLGPIAILFTIYAGFIYLTAGDNEENTKKAKTMIIAGVTGIIIIYSAYAIINTLISAELALLPLTNLIA